jgi:hypothetical protein
MSKNKGHENIIPLTERSPEEAKAIRRKGAKASAKVRRQKSDFKKAAEAILLLEMPKSDMRDFLESYNLPATMEYALLFSSIYEGIKKGDTNALMKLREIVQQDKPTEDKQEQRARIERIKAETEKIKEETARKSGKQGAEVAEKQAQAIADMINSPEAERALEDYLGADE